VEKCEDDIINRVFVVGNCSLGQVFAQNLSVINQGYLGCCPPSERPAGVADLPGIGCACWEEEEATANETDYLNAMQMQMQWDNVGEDGGSCPLNCPETEKAHASVRS
jgi:hypothetical protein